MPVHDALKSQSPSVVGTTKGPAMSLGLVPYGPGLNGTSGGVFSSHASSHVIIVPESGIDPSGIGIVGLSEQDARQQKKAHQRAIRGFYIHERRVGGAFRDARTRARSAADR